MYDYPLEVFYSETVLSINSNIVTVNIGLNTFSLIFMFYIIVFCSAGMNFYPWLLFFGFLAGYVLDLVLFTCRWVQFLPGPLFYFDGIIGKYMSGKLMLSLLFSFIMVKLLMLNLILLYRYAMGVGGKLQEFMHTKSHVAVIYIVSCILGFLPMIVMVLQEKSPYDYIYEEIPVLKNLTFGSNLTYIPRTWTYQLIVWAFIVQGVSTK